MFQACGQSGILVDSCSWLVANLKCRGLTTLSWPKCLHCPVNHLYNLGQIKLVIISFICLIRLRWVGSLFSSLVAYCKFYSQMKVSGHLLNIAVKAARIGIDFGEGKSVTHEIALLSVRPFVSRPFPGVRLQRHRCGNSKLDRTQFIQVLLEI